MSYVVRFGVSVDGGKSLSVITEGKFAAPSAKAARAVCLEKAAGLLRANEEVKVLAVRRVA